MPRVFISRKLERDSAFRQLLLPYGVEIVDVSLVAFQGLPFGQLPVVDYWFFYSKNGVKFFFEQYPHRKNLPKIAAIGKGTAAFLEANYQLKANWIGDGHPERTAKAFAEVAQGTKVLFLQARNSKQSVQKHLLDQVLAEDLVVYDNRIKTNFDIPNVEILVFTSPMNVKAYFTKYPYQEQAIICIGQTTAKAIQRCQIENYLVAAEPSEAAMAKACAQLLVKK